MQRGRNLGAGRVAEGDALRDRLELVLLAGVTDAEVLGAVLTEVHRDAVDPRRELRVAAEGADGLEDLDEDALIQILSEPKNALVKQYQRLFDMEGVKLEFNDEALSAIAKKAIERKTGARGLRSIMENMLMDTMYEVPDKEGVEKVIVSKDTVDEGKPPVYVVTGEGGKKKKKEVEAVEA